MSLLRLYTFYIHFYFYISYFNTIILLFTILPLGVIESQGFLVRESVIAATSGLSISTDNFETFKSKIGLDFGNWSFF